MSFILDALRKSEIERQRQSGPSMAEFPIAREDRRLPIALIVIGFLLAVNLAVVAFFLLRDDEPAEVAAPQAAAAPAATTAAAQPAPPPVQAQPAGPSPLESEALPQDTYETEPPAVYYEPPTQAPGAPDPTLLPGAGQAAGAAPDVAMASDEYAAAAAATGLPELTIDLHIYAADPAKRAVFINGQRYTRGARLTEGPLVEDITPEGALLSYRGRRFLLPRL